MNVLGINDGHLATAAILKDRKIISCVSEERFTRKKNQAGMPLKAISYCLESADLKPEDVDFVVFGGKLMPPTTGEVKMKESLYTNVYGLVKPILTGVRQAGVQLPMLRDFEENVYKYMSRLMEPMVMRQRREKLMNNFDFSKADIIAMDHHLAHVYSVLYSSEFSKKLKDLLILTCDGEGDGLSATVSVYKKGKLKKLSETSMINSLGNFYRSVTKDLGMKPLEHEYKVMGLAAYVNEDDPKAEELYGRLKDLFEIDTHSIQIKTKVNSQLFKMGYLEQVLDGERFDHIAAASQKLTEDILTDWVKAAIKKTKVGNVLLSGGVFMNVKANQQISELPEVSDLFIMPSCGDESNAIGACYWGCEKMGGHSPSPLTDLYLGPEFGENEIKNALKKKWKVTKPKSMAKVVAKLLANGEVVARMDGRMEWGARALGNRSILADPTKEGVVDTINRMIKKRDFWMPFAPVVMKRHHKKYLKNPKNIDASYMILSFETTERGAESLKAGIHQYDKTARPQLVDRKTNPKYYEILEEFSKLTGRYGLLNTSFNLHGYPIVCSPEDALHVFKNSDLKYLVLGDFLVEKK